MRNSVALFLPEHGPNRLMLYSKPSLSFENQADLLIRRGLIANRAELIARLRAVNYYRLSGYLFPYRQRDSRGKTIDDFVPGTTLDEVWRRYNFDRRLRMIILDSIERIEVAVRTRLVYHFVARHGPFGHLVESNLPGFKKRTVVRHCWRNICSLVHLRGLEMTSYESWLRKLTNEKERASDGFVKHFKASYGDNHSFLPLWMACELMTCETTLQLLNGVEDAVLKDVASSFNFPDQQLLSWTKAIFALRNSCAHHARIWNRVFGAKPSIPGKNKYPAWHQPTTFAADRAGMMLTVCYVWLGAVTTTSQWRSRLFALFDDFPEIPVSDMGMPANWRTHPLWV
jgi:abortive infection bacteriophage resistance protein